MKISTHISSTTKSHYGVLSVVMTCDTGRIYSNHHQGRLVVLNYLTPWNRELLQKLIVTDLVSKLPGNPKIHYRV
jgi:hypothetical protein